MSAVQASSSFRRRKKSYATLVLVIIVVVIIIAVSIGAGIFMVSQTARSIADGTGVILSCLVTGNDLVVTLYDKGPSDQIDAVELVMEGYALPPGYGLKELEGTEYPKQVVYEDIVKGIYSDIQILIKGRFTDGSMKTICVEIIRIS